MMGVISSVLMVLLLHYLAGTRGEEVVVHKVEVPDYVRHGDDIELKCHWEAAPNNNLYSLKWYLNDREFFSFKPEEVPNITVHHLPGVNVNMELSTGERVVLTNVELDSTGKYKCEVITEAPNFHTADKSALMTVVQIPEEKPRIYGTLHKYHIGDTAHLTCVSAMSLPPARLTWYINDKEAPRQYVVFMNNSRSEQNGLMETRKGLKFVVSREHFHDGEMHLRCSAMIPTLYYKTQQHSVEDELTYNVPVMESRDISAYSGSSSNTCYGQQQRQVVVLAGLLTILLEVMITGVLAFSPS